MNKFKIGDKVRFVKIGVHGGNEVRIGNEATVIGTKECSRLETCYLVEFPNYLMETPNIYYVHEESIEHARYTALRRLPNA